MIFIQVGYELQSLCSEIYCRAKYFSPEKNRVTQDVVWDYSRNWAENVQKIQTVNILFYKYSNNSVCYENCQKGKQTKNKKNQKIPDLAIFYQSKFCYFGNI